VSRTRHQRIMSPFRNKYFKKYPLKSTSYTKTICTQHCTQHLDWPHVQIDCTWRNPRSTLLMRNAQPWSSLPAGWAARWKARCDASTACRCLQRRIGLGRLVAHTRYHWPVHHPPSMESDEVSNFERPSKAAYLPGRPEPPLA